MGISSRGGPARSEVVSGRGRGSSMGVDDGPSFLRRARRSLRPYAVRGIRPRLLFEPDAGISVATEKGSFLSRTRAPELTSHVGENIEKLICCIQDAVRRSDEGQATPSSCEVVCRVRNACEDVVRDSPGDEPGETICTSEIELHEGSTGSSVESDIGLSALSKRCRDLLLPLAAPPMPFAQEEGEHCHEPGNRCCEDRVHLVVPSRSRSEIPSMSSSPSSSARLGASGLGHRPWPPGWGSFSGTERSKRTAPRSNPEARTLHEVRAYRLSSARRAFLVCGWSGP